VGDEPILDWLRFLDSDEVKSMEAIAEKNEGVRRAVSKYKELTVAENARILAQLREKDKLLEEGRLEYAWDEGVAEGIEKGRAEGLTEGRAEGLTEGRAEGLTKGRAERNAEIARRLADLGKTDAEIAEILGDV
jgi:flagellar biosynthesis/type III secretory pathway protein FliH